MAASCIVFADVASGAAVQLNPHTDAESGTPHCASRPAQAFFVGIVNDATRGSSPGQVWNLLVPPAASMNAFASALPGATLLANCSMNSRSWAM